MTPAQSKCHFSRRPFRLAQDRSPSPKPAFYLHRCLSCTDPLWVCCFPLSWRLSDSLSQTYSCLSFSTCLKHSCSINIASVVGYFAFVLELEQLGKTQFTIGIELVIVCWVLRTYTYLGVFRGLLFLDSHLSAAYSHGIIKMYTLEII